MGNEELLTVPSDWFDPVTKRIDDATGQEISKEDWKRWEWYDVTTMQGYEPGVHKYVKMHIFPLRES